MAKDVVSKHLGGASELLLLIPIKTESVPGLSYATRLQVLLDNLGKLRQQEAENRGEDGSGPLDRLQSIYTTQWAVINGPANPRLLVSACFDRSWEDYVRILVDKTGSLLDLLFLHCEGYEGHTCVKDGYEAFSAWLRSHQIQVSLFHTGLPNVTVDDVRYYRKLATQPAGASTGSGDHRHPHEGRERAIGEASRRIERGRKDETRATRSRIG